MTEEVKTKHEGKHSAPKKKMSGEKKQKIMAGIAGSMVLLVAPLPFIVKHNSANSSPNVSPTSNNSPITSSDSPTSTASPKTKNTITSNIHTLAPIPKKTILPTRKVTKTTTSRPSVTPMHTISKDNSSNSAANTTNASNISGNDTNYAVPNSEKIDYGVGSHGSQDGINYSIDANGIWTITGKFQDKDIASTVQKTLKYSNGQIPNSLLCNISNIQLRCDAAAQMYLLNKAYINVFHSNLHFTQGYRSLSDQYSIKASWAARGASYMAAEPGTSNHGLGLAVDFSAPDGQAGTPQHTWLVNNSKNFGWVWPSYMQPGGSGPQESWHFQFNGFGIDGASLSTNSRSALRTAEKNKNSHPKSSATALPTHTVTNPKPSTTSSTTTKTNPTAPSTNSITPTVSPTSPSTPKDNSPAPVSPTATVSTSK